ncbi:MAG: biosynthetic-type acetolactate synthase large subunit [Ruminococcus sp.]|jgi:acetolactate synthase-1/2/3 large subunit|nr:biosynthetic-type acetolactate synthase large subunit [Ruminococcus sp.]
MNLSGAAIVVETLIEQGCDTVFGYPGGQVINLFDELYKHSDRITNVLTAHEQGAAHAADGYARATGRVGVVIATSGPGATNLVTGIATAHLDSVPLVAITGNVPCSLIGRDSFQEVDIIGITMPITKHNFIVKDVSKLADTLRLAFRIAKSGRPGPVLVDIPKDVQVNKCDFQLQTVAPAFEKITADNSQLLEAAKMIAQAKKPYIYCGGGVISGGASDEVMALAEKADAYIGCSMMGISAVPTSNPRFLGMQGMHGHYASSMAQNEADLIIAAGARFSDRATGNKSKFAVNAKIIHIDIDDAELEKNIPVYLGIQGDVKDSLSRLTAMIDSQKNSEWQQRISQLKNDENAMIKTSKALTPYNIIDIISSGADENTVIVTDVGQHQMWTAQRYPFMKPRKFISSGGLGTMGFGMGAAIGANVATGCKTVLVTGDGSFGMNLNELAAAVSQNCSLVIVIMNNGVLGMVRQWQTLFFDKRYSNTTLNRKTNFIKLAEAFGAKGFKAETTQEFADAFKKAFSNDGPSVIDCSVDCDEFVLPMLPPGGSIDDIITEIKEDEK